MSEFQDFADRVGQHFTVQTPAAELPAILASCTATGPAGDSSSFTLTFTSDSDVSIGQGNYSVAGAGFGPELIFLVPIGNGSEWEAVFNRRSAG
jgi:hypothetical protein